MSAIDFPANPGSLTPPNYWTANSGVQYRWDGEKWVSTGGSATYIGMGGTGANFVTGDIKFSDTKGVKFGAADDLAIYHDGTNNYIDFDTGELRLSVAGTSKMTLDSSGNVVFPGDLTIGAITAAGDVKAGEHDPAATDKRGVRIAIDSSHGGCYVQAKGSITSSVEMAFQALHGTTEKFKVLYDGEVTAAGAATFGGDLTVNTDALFVDASAKSVGIGTVYPTQKLDVRGNVYIGSNIQIDGTATLAGDLTINTDALFVDASAKNVGIGTTSPGQALTLDVNDSGTTLASFNGINIANSDTTTNNGAVLTFGQTVAGNSNARIGVIHTARGPAESQEMFFGLLGSGAYLEAMRIDSSGRVGIGTTSPQEHFVVSNSGAEGFEVVAGAGSNTNVIQNYNRSTSAYSNLRFDAATYNFRIGTSEAMQINSSGRVGIGTTTFGSNANLQVGVGGASIALGGDPYTNSSGYLKFIASNSVTNWQVGTNVTIGGAFEIMPSTAAGGSTFSAPAMYITSAGAATFAGDVISGGDAYNGANNGCRFYSPGQLLVSRTGGTNTVFEGYTTGNSTPTSKITANGAATFSPTGAKGIVVEADNRWGNECLVLQNTNTSASSTYHTLLCKNQAGANAFSVTLAGIVTTPMVSGTYGDLDMYSNSSYGINLWSDSMILARANNSTAGVYMTESATSWSSWSDERLKENITELSGALDTLKDVRCIEFSHKTDGLSEPDRYGIIAQDLIGKYDHVLSKTSLPEGDDDTEYYGVAYTELIPVLIKAVQELSAKVAALENS